MGIDADVSKVLTLSVTDDDIGDFIAIFRALKDARNSTGFIKAATLTDQQWKVVEAMCDFFPEFGTRG